MQKPICYRWDGKRARKQGEWECGKLMDLLMQYRRMPAHALYIYIIIEYHEYTSHYIRVRSTYLVP